MDDEIYEISSELYEEYDYSSNSKPIVNSKNVVSKFLFKLPNYSIEDKEGDMLVPRKKSDNEFIELGRYKDIPHLCLDKIVNISEHSYCTTLNMVGLQIWRGALLLADWLLHNGKAFTKDEYILELGTGVGLTSIVASMFSPVICTDIDRGDIFKIIRANVDRNKHFSKYPVDVLELDFMSQNLSERIVSLLPKINTVIAADVVYDDSLTEAFVKTVQKLLDIPPKRSILIALEKRYVFTISDCDTCAPCYDYFLEKLKILKNVSIEEITTDFPQYFKYDRCKELVLWKITSKL
ncbi:unnamed protein product [Ceutorhynchus assimilis]|uniref:Methyltransferase-like protein 22 n=1 Tax=Ceutorhynchus assimilis TaxID=467358 RepID=A0A9N9MS53_9CUCU|nr:unnamed protein product [Ceutorhynchus assimilis]